jgi:hypothetical protein
MTEIDERYKEGKIYGIRNITDDTKIYIGSTIISLAQRFKQHKTKCKNGIECVLYNNIENNDWTLWYIELYENYPCNSKKELERREGELIRDIGTLNMNVAGRTIQEYRKEKPDKIKETKKKYYEKNIEKIEEYRKKYNTENADKIKEHMRAYRKENADKLKKKYSEQKVCCSICGSLSSEKYLTRHQKTKKCQEASQ